MKEDKKHVDMLKVVSASRRVDLVGAYPDKLIELLREKAPPERTHTLVIWTKNPSNLLHCSELIEEVGKYRSLFLHVSVTGMGGTVLEPGVPAAEEVLLMLDSIVELAGGGEHVRLRFDPIVHIRIRDGTIYTNSGYYEEVARAASNAGIHNVSISWMQVYRKVIRHLKARGMAAVVISEEQMLEELSVIQKISDRYGITLHGCCVPVMPVSRCIDGFILEELHPDNLPCSKVKAKGQRELCGCTESYDIGWYEPCLHGCVYCYANPKVE